MQRLNGLDASFLYLETPSTHMHVVGVLVLDPSSMPDGYRFERVREMLEARLHLLPPFRRRLVEVPFGLDHPVWVEDPDFDLDSHLHRATLPPPGTIRELADMVSDVASRPLDRRRPLWELWAVEGLDDDRVAVVTKMHHAAIDGVSGADLMVHLFDLEPDAADPDPVADEWQPDRLPSDLELMARAVSARATQPARLARQVVRTGRSLVEVARTVSTFGNGAGASAVMPFTAPRTRFSGAITPHRVVAFGKAELDDLRAIKSTFGTTVNDAVLAACTRTLQRYLRDHDDLPDKPLVCTVPVSVRGEEADGDLGNKVSSMFVRLPVQLDDPVEQLRTIAEDTRDAKRVHNAVGADMLQDWTEFAPPAVFSLAMRLYSSMNLADRHRPAQNLVVSNIPGPPVPLYTAGARVLATYPLGPIMEGAGINITVLSNMGSMDFGIIACPETVPDVWDIADGFGEAVAELKALADKELGSSSSSR